VVAIRCGAYPECGIVVAYGGRASYKYVVRAYLGLVGSRVC